MFTLSPEKYTLCNFLLFLGLIVCKETKRRPCIFSHRPRYKNPDFFFRVFRVKWDFYKIAGFLENVRTLDDNV